MDNKHRITLQDVAREAGVSPMTVSRVVNNTGRISEATREHVRAVIERLGYRPSRAARALVTRRTYMIGVIVPDITNPFFNTMVQGIEDVATEAGYSVLLVNTNETPAREEAALRHLDDSTIDGLIVCSSRLATDKLVSLLEPYRALVVLNRRLPDDIASRIHSRHPRGSRALIAARYLASHGHARIGFVSLKRRFGEIELEDYLVRLAEEGIHIAPEWCVKVLPSWSDGYRMGRALLITHPELTAIIGGNDLVALGVMAAARELGRSIPDDLALIGADDILVAQQVTPPLTTFRIDTYGIGTTAANLLLPRIEGDMTFREYLYDELFVERGSAP